MAELGIETTIADIYEANPRVNRVTVEKKAEGYVGIAKLGHYSIVQTERETSIRRCLAKLLIKVRKEKKR